MISPKVKEAIRSALYYWFLPQNVSAPTRLQLDNFHGRFLQAVKEDGKLAVPMPLLGPVACNIEQAMPVWEQTYGLKCYTADVLFYWWKDLSPASFRKEKYHNMYTFGKGMLLDSDGTPLLLCTKDVARRGTKSIVNHPVLRVSPTVLSNSRHRIVKKWLIDYMMPLLASVRVYSGISQSKEKTKTRISMQMQDLSQFIYTVPVPTVDTDVTEVVNQQLSGNEALINQLFV